MAVTKRIETPKAVTLPTTGSSGDNSTTLELLALLTAAQFYAKKLATEKAETRMNYVKMIDMLVAYLRKEMA